MIRQKVSTILDVAIREGRWVTYTAALDREGKFDRRKILDILMTLCEEMELMEQELEALKAQPQPVTIADDGVETTDLFFCPVCQKSFSTKFALMGHQRSHKDEPTAA